MIEHLLEIAYCDGRATEAQYMVVFEDMAPDRADLEKYWELKDINMMRQIIFWILLLLSRGLLMNHAGFATTSSSASPSVLSSTKVWKYSDVKYAVNQNPLA
ncbi:MAG: hypothetical protein ACRBCL_12535 [Maritimibacter sp.]